MLIFCTYIQIFAHCNCLSFSEWHIYCVITLLSHLLWIYHVCAFVCTHMCVHMCIYTFHLHTSRTYIFSCIYAHKILRIYKHLSTLAYLFVCLIIYVCLCAMHYFYMYTPVPTSALIFCDCYCAWAYFHCIHIYIQRSIENDDASNSSYDKIRNHRCDLLHNPLSTVDEPLYHLECDNISVVLLLVAMLMIYFQPSHVNYIACAYACACACSYTNNASHNCIYSTFHDYILLHDCEKR